MPRIVKDLPEDRSQWRFGDLVYWHLFKYGTRPSGDPSDIAGRLWEQKTVCSLLGISERTLRNWIQGKTFPDEIVALSSELFGDKAAWDEQRLELQLALEEGRAERSRKATPPTAPPVENETPSIAPETLGPPSEEPSVTSGMPAPTNNEASGAPPLRKKVPGFIVGLMLTLGLFSLTPHGREGEKKQAATSGPATKAPEPTVAPPAPTRVVAPAPEPKTQPPVVVPVKETPAPITVAPPVRIEPILQPPPAPVIAPKDSEPTQAEIEAQRQRQANIAAFEKGKREEVQEAIALDKDDGSIAKARERDDDAREAAALGFTLRENTGATGPSLGNVLASSASECARLCTERGCDAFAFYRDQYGPGSTRSRYCYMYRKPLTPYANPGYAYGERTAPAASAPASPRAEATAPIRLAQAGSSSATDAGDGVVQCANGPVKVSGFQLKCDSILSGGTTLGSTQLSYAVRNINECAAKCRPVKNCVGFTFNAADAEGRHACMIFGPTPEGRDSSGWISGVR